MQRGGVGWLGGVGPYLFSSSSLGGGVGFCVLTSFSAVCGGARWLGGWVVAACLFSLASFPLCGGGAAVVYILWFYLRFYLSASLSASLIY